MVSALQQKGYCAVNIPQEHSVSKRFWRRLSPDCLIYLSCTLETARKRRKIQWGQERLDEQWEILSEVRAHANVIIPTDDLSKEQVFQMAEAAIIKCMKKET